MAADLSTLLPPPPRRVSKQATTRPVAIQEMVVAVQEGNAVTKPSRQLQRLPPIRGGGGGGARTDGRNKNGATAATGAAERAAKAWMRQALAKLVATRMLKRSTAPPRALPAAADEGSGGGRAKKVLACCCARLPRGLRCALHQAAAPGRAWMRAAQRPRGGDGGECVAVVALALAPPRAHGWAFSEYARWRRHVWMPSRFYLEHVDPRALLELPCSAEIDACVVDSSLR
jgi:hypothetical protein